MQLKKVQINGFGKLENVKLELKDGLNLILGENESGKSTLTEFIKGIFYGVNRNKAGKDFSDFEKYKPWQKGNFSGKLSYNLDGQEYTVYREFTRNHAEIYDKMGADISNDFNKDKSRGAEIGVAHLGMDEDTFDNSVFVRQKDIKVNELSQNTMIQKLTNIVQTGEEEVSYENTIKKLEKKLLDEIGTERTQNKPKNIVKREIANLELTKSKLQHNRVKQEEIESKIKQVQDSKKKNEKELKDAIAIFNIKNKYEQIIQEEKTKFDLEKKVNETQKDKNKKEKRKKIIIDSILISLGAFVLAITGILIDEIALAIFGVITGVVALILNAKFTYKEEILVEPENFDVISEESRKKANKELATLEEKGIKKSLTEKSISELKTIIANGEKEKNNLTLEEHKLKIEEEALNENLTTLSEVEEELVYQKAKQDELLKEEETIQLAIEKLKEAYEELKEEIIPDIEKDIRYTISKTTNGKYTNVKYNDYDGLIIENEFGQMVTVDKLSVGTIDQMYLGFRLAIADKYHNIPILFDEAFVFCDDERLKNILKTLSEIAENRQIILLSCSNREKILLDEMKIQFNYIKI